MPGVRPDELAEADLVRELEHLHMTRHTTFLHGSSDALAEHSSRTGELEREYVRRHPDRKVDPARTRKGARALHQPRPESTERPDRPGAGDPTGSSTLHHTAGPEGRDSVDRMSTE
ncbi:hypothetical protein SAMN05216207_105815 [Pseudonocardia ammonioxydans]|uniref:Uncharacterized protein n=2 Tax=Pseudonocardia ammonioxydans TaxID=260086 RepID=A0A1I5H6N0_PSUAM|nr:hypothetical protein SAMN05216207_105815 [Pseudonocardia ammonioxydans]